ncbi:Proline--tRNA ligase [Anaerohalosphaera lusitana]|uniref:Proline--tRNA ligase n=1 Tax=Anaerohalosphaera lusitana TaxID=1936003 RepID=A0A1U9NIP2_9BACT|nr:proline--tRNA ligase [Anaerohalosphaera lusitana]AQT67657.1 Proline--tRNA ligase [Anaerohalosphaera lusitana]
MRYSKALIPTVKETPSDAEIVSHQLMLRAGLMRKIASGTYMYLPAGMRVLNKVMNIVREEMDRSGAQESLAPCVHPIELWQQTGRDVDYGETLGTFTDRHGRGNVLAPTAEEAFTFLGASEINSYKQLPLNLYQISFKYRDEFRPRFGVLRSREFIMKDAYSFHPDDECLQKTYMEMYDAYCRIFERAGVDYVIVEAETGEMGGSGSHQFTVPCENGEDVIVYTEEGGRAWNIEKAPVDPPVKVEAVDVGAMEDVHTPGVGTIEEVCRFLKTQASEMIKTLILKTAEGEVVGVLLRGDHELNDEKITQLLGGVGYEMADDATVFDVTGAAVGFAGPVGLAENVSRVFVDPGVAAMGAGISGANKTDYHVKNVVPGRDFAIEGEKVQVADVRNAVEGDTYDGKPLKFKRGIEVGQVFKLGTKYSEKLGAKFLDADGVEKPCLMGCYGIGINRIMASAIELGNDDNGIIWPISIAPWEVIITLAGATDEIVEAGEKLYNELTAAGVEVLLDDRDVRAGVKFKDADLLGIPVRVTIGKKSLADGKVEMKLRTASEREDMELDKASEEVAGLVKTMKAELAEGKE